MGRPFHPSLSWLLATKKLATSEYPLKQSTPNPLPSSKYLTFTVSSSLDCSTESFPLFIYKLTYIYYIYTKTFSRYFVIANSVVAVYGFLVMFVPSGSFLQQFVIVFDLVTNYLDHTADKLCFWNFSRD